MLIPYQTEATVQFMQKEIVVFVNRIFLFDAQSRLFIKLFSFLPLVNLTKYQAPVVQKVDNTIHRMAQLVSQILGKSWDSCRFC